MDDMKKHVEALIRAAGNEAEGGNATSALQFAQAAERAAAAIGILSHLPRPEDND